MSIAFSLLLGLLFGSFANVIIFRVPKKISLLTPRRSYCPSCNTALTAVELVPLVSYIWLKGKCRHCGGKISLQYPAVELSCGLLFAVISLVYPVLTVSFFLAAAVTVILLCITVIDGYTQTIPDSLVVALVVAAVGFVWAINGLEAGLLSALLAGIIGAVAGGAPLLGIDIICRALLKKDAFGYGDVKLMAAAGLFLGAKMAFLALFIAVVTGGLWAAFLVLRRKKKAGNYISFGPFLTTGIFVSMLCGQVLISGYLKWIGLS